ncbi:MAG: Asp-tRNA(Asn)/Glu-tRNA(Gln) amidotransferase subunit GatB [Candidatus Cloacimonetes bacterium]|nr:Asp-tRNA(Asn)/Glu-tRNA(Gln) amidotransferase subunit GatB [Candidatus Cloacimonadota bacterium]
MKTKNRYTTYIGLELHAQLLTKSKMFCGCKNSFGEKPNSQTCPVCLGLPGSLPVVNREALNQAIKFGLATDSNINMNSWFDRKNYFYPDLPKGYQITQFAKPLAQGGVIELSGNNKVHLQEIHLEEDSARSVHYEDYVKEGYSYLDFNRSGIPLLEIVTEPDLCNSSEVVNFLKHIIKIMQYLKICNGKLQDGSLRCDLNISVGKNSDSVPDWKVEVKNLNSLKAIKKAVKFEEKRLIEMLEKGMYLEQQTRKWDEKKGVTELLRSKEKDYDYRYFPDPDLPQINLEETYIKEIEDLMPELPAKKQKRFMEEYGLDTDSAELLTRNQKIADFFEESLKFYNNPDLTARIIIGDFFAFMNEVSEDFCKKGIKPVFIAEIVEMLDKNMISNKIVKKIFSHFQEKILSPKEMVKNNNWNIINDNSQIKKIIENTIINNPEEVKRYQAGNQNLMNFFIGKVMQKTQGRAKGEKVKRILKELLKEMN